MVNDSSTPRLDLPRTEVEQYYAIIHQLADEARKVAAPMLARDFVTETKDDASIVTEIDRAIELRLRTIIEEHFPQHGIVGEEFPAYQPTSAYQWILDPIDGTEELIHHVPMWGVMLALHYEGTPVVGVIDHPALDIRVSAGVGLGAWRNGVRTRLPAAPATPQRIRLAMSARANFMRGIDEGYIFDEIAKRFPNHRIYRAAFAHTAAVTGAVDAMVDAHNAIWDLAASQILIEEAGGTYVVVRDVRTANSRTLTAIFGRRNIVEQLVRLF